jgi:hypothetical protein
MKNSDDTIGYQTCDIPASIEVPQPTAPPRVPVVFTGNGKCPVHISDYISLGEGGYFAKSWLFLPNLYT